MGLIGLEMFRRRFGARAERLKGAAGHFFSGVLHKKAASRTEAGLGRDVCAPGSGLTFIQTSSQINTAGRRKKLPMCDPTQRRTANPQFVFTSKLFVSLTACGLIFFLAEFARAGSATWDLDPISGDWNTAANWTPASVPNGPADIATFGLSNTTFVSISEDTQVNSI